MQQLLTQLGAGEILQESEAELLFSIILSGEAEETQIAFALGAMSARGETAGEITGAVRALREKALLFPSQSDENLIDTCGTGGDKKGSYNISTAVAFVAAGAGAKVAKHGNKAVSSKAGSSDVLQALGVKIDAAPETMRRALDQGNMCFLLAPGYHSAMRHVAPVRAALKTRTIFNLLGPLLNPAQLTRQVVGVYHPSVMALYAEILLQLGVEHSMIVHGTDGMDEISLSAETVVTHIQHGEIQEYSITPEQFGFARVDEEALKGGDAAHNAAALEAVLKGEAGAYHDIVLLNAAAALVVAGVAGSMEDGIEKAASSIDSGAAYDALQSLITVSNAA